MGLAVSLSYFPEHMPDAWLIIPETRGLAALAAPMFGFRGDFCEGHHPRRKYTHQTRQNRLLDNKKSAPLCLWQFLFVNTFDLFEIIKDVEIRCAVTSLLDSQVVFSDMSTAFRCLDLVFGNYSVKKNWHFRVRVTIVGRRTVPRAFSRAPVHHFEAAWASYYQSVQNAGDPI